MKGPSANGRPTDRGTCIGRRRLAGVGLAVVLAAGASLLTTGGRVSAAPGSDQSAAGRGGPVQQVEVGGGAGAVGGLGQSNSSGALYSRNWAGYSTYLATQATNFTFVKATWVQPAATCPTANAWSVFWVGLDGQWDGTVEQAGSSVQCVGGVPQYRTWWEMYPTNNITTVFVVNPGDTITASVAYNPTTASFTINVADSTAGRSFRKVTQCGPGLVCNRSSAEVIAEAVGSGTGTYYPLANYGTMTFSGTHITNVAGHQGSIRDSNWLNAAVTEQSGSTIYATVTPLVTNGLFSATWTHV